MQQHHAMLDVGEQELMLLSTVLFLVLNSKLDFLSDITVRSPLISLVVRVVLESPQVPEGSVIPHQEGSHSERLFEVALHFLNQNVTRVIVLVLLVLIVVIFFAKDVE